MKPIYVYALKSLVRNYIYVGMTDNLDRRIIQHNNGENRSTKAYRTFVLILQEEFPSRIEARKREKFLKAGSGNSIFKLSPFGILDSRESHFFGIRWLGHLILHLDEEQIGNLL